jgi:hypothetical protein
MTQDTATAQRFWARDVSADGRVVVRLVEGTPCLLKANQALSGGAGAEFFTEGPSARSPVVRVREVRTGLEIAWGRYRDDAIRAAERALRQNRAGELQESIARMEERFGPLPEVPGA